MCYAGKTNGGVDQCVYVVPQNVLFSTKLLLDDFARPMWLRRRFVEFCGALEYVLM